MRLTYRPEDDALYLRLSEEGVAESEEVAPGTVLDFDADGQVVAVEIYSGAASKVDLSKLLLERRQDGSDADFSIDAGFLTQPALKRASG